MELVNLKKISMKNNKDLSEAFIQRLIADNPRILGLGDLYLVDKERCQPGAGRLDLLLRDSEEDQRYEVEIQLGKIDESHIIRTIEYWDIEKKRYPIYEHYAVIVAEEMTSRFLNVVQLLNGTIPLIALQMNAYEVDGKIGLVFTKILDAVLKDDEEEVAEITDRKYWEEKASKETVELTERLYAYIQKIDPNFELKYNKRYIGLSKNGKAKNFVSFKPKKNFLSMLIKLPLTEEYETEITKSGLENMGYDGRRGFYKLRLNNEDFIDKEESIRRLLELSYIYIVQ